MRIALGLLAAIALTSVGSRSLEAQESSDALDVETIRALMIHGFEQHRAMDIEFTRAIPDSALRWKPTPGVRDFAQQIEHIVMDNVMFVDRGVWDGDRPSFGEAAVYLNDKVELEELVAGTYDWVLEVLKALPKAELTAETELFGQQLPKWRVFLQALHHADWTRGQLVSYYRLNGVSPPDWRLY